MPRRIITSVLLTVIGLILAFGQFELMLLGVTSWRSFLPIVFIISGILIYKSIPAGHYIAVPLLAFSLYSKIRFLVELPSNDHITLNIHQVLRFYGPGLALIIFYCLVLILIVRDLIKLKISPDYKLNVKQLNEPEIWIYPWLISLICLYILRYDFEVSYFIYLLSPIALFFIHKILKNSTLVMYEDFKKAYIVSSVLWFIIYALIIGFSGYILALIAAGLASQGAGQ